MDDLVRHIVQCSPLCVNTKSGKTSTFVKDSGDFVEKARSIRLEEGSILVSFDVPRSSQRSP